MLNSTINKFKDNSFKTVGIFSTLIGILILAYFLIDIIIEGAGRIDFDFLNNLPSRKAEKAGILPA